MIFIYRTTYKSIRKGTMGRKSIAHIRRKEIIEGFFTVVAEKGFAEASVREITKAAGVSNGVLHHYFTNKEAMVLGVMDYVLTSYMEQFQKELLKHQNAADRMRFVFSWFFDLDRFTLKFSRAWMEFWVLSKTNPAISKALQECYRTVKETIAGIILAGIQAGEFRKVNPIVTANLIVSCMEGATMLWVVDTKATPMKTMGKRTAELFLDDLMGKKRGWDN